LESENCRPGDIYRVDHHDQNEISVLDVDCFMETASVRRTDGTGTLYGVSTVIECLEACLENELCVAIDWEPHERYGRKCWILTSTTTQSTTWTGLHYELNPACRS